MQNLNIPQYLKNKYKCAFEIKQSSILKQSIDRSIFIDQSQSLNIFMNTPDFNKLHSCHFYAWENGLKTGMYYLRSQPIVDAIKFNIDHDVVNNIKKKKSNNIEQSNIKKIKSRCNEDVCEICSA